MFFKKKVKIKQNMSKGNFDDLDFDDLDFGDLGSDDFDFDKAEKSRTPITNVSKGLIKGLKNAVFDHRKHTKTVLKNLPESFDVSYDLLTEGIGTIADEVRTGARELAPEIGKMASGIEKLVPSKFKRTKDKLNKLQEKLRNESPESISPERAREDNISQVLDSVFQQQYVDRQIDRQRDNAYFAMSEKMENARHKQTNQNLSMIAQGVATTNAYNLQVNTAYQRKLLEIQLRSYYVQADTLALLKNDNASVKEMLAGILLNTGLPEYAKLTEKERFKQAMRKELFDNSKNKLYKSADYFSQIIKGTSASIKNKVTDTKSMLQFINDSLADLLMSRETGESTTESLTTLGSEMAFGSIISKYLKKGLNKFGINKDNEYVKKAQKFTKNIYNPRKMMEGLATKIEDSEYNPNILVNLLGKLGSPLAEAIRGASGRKESFDIKETAETLLSPAVYSRFAQNSITKIIPGYLSRILQQTARTGNLIQLYSVKRAGFSNDDFKDTTPELVMYNPYTSVFEGESKLKSYLNKQYEQTTDRDTQYRLFKNSIFAMTQTDKGMGEMKELLTIYRNRVSYSIDILKKMANGINSSKIKDEDTFSLKDDIKKTIKELEEFEKENLGSNANVLSLDTNELNQLLYTADMLISDSKRIINQYLPEYLSSTVKSRRYDSTGKKIKTESSLESLISQNAENSEQNRRISESIEKKKAYIDKDTKWNEFSQLMHKYDIDDLSEAINNKNILDELKYNFGWTPGKINNFKKKIKEIDKNSSESTKEAKIKIASQFRESANTGIDTLAQQRELTGITSNTYSALKDGRLSIKNAYNFVRQASDFAKIEDLKTLQNKIKEFGFSRNIQRKLNFVLNKLNPEEKLSFLRNIAQAQSQGNISQVTNLINDSIQSIQNTGKSERDILKDTPTGSTSSGFGVSTGTFTSDKALKNVISSGLKSNYQIKGYDQNDAAYKLANVPLSTWTYKSDQDKIPHYGAMAQDLNKQFGDVVAPKGKKIDIASMFGVLSQAVGDLKKDALIKESVIAGELASIRKDFAKYITTNLTLKGFSPTSIKKIFDKEKTVESISKIVRDRKSQIKDSLEDQGIDTEHGVKRFASTSKKRVITILTQNRHSRKLKDNLDEIGIDTDNGIMRLGSTTGKVTRFKLLRYHNIVKARTQEHIAKAQNYSKSGKIESNLGNVERSIKSVFNSDKDPNEIKAEMSKLVARDIDDILTANNTQDRASALGSLFSTLVAGGIGAVGSVSRFAYAKTAAKLVKKGYDFAQSNKNINCNSDVYLGTKSETPIMLSVNYRTDVKEDMYYNKKTGKRITSACQITGPVIRANGDPIFTEDQIKNPGLFVRNKDGIFIRLKGLKFYAISTMNAGLKLARYLGKKILHNNKVNKSLNWAHNKLYKIPGIHGMVDLGKATISELKGEGGLKDFLDQKMQSAYNATGRGKGRIAKMLTPLTDRINYFGNKLYSDQELDENEAENFKKYREQRHNEREQEAAKWHDQQVNKQNKLLDRAQADHLKHFASADKATLDAHFLKEKEKIERRIKDPVALQHALAAAHMRHYGSIPEALQFKHYNPQGLKTNNGKKRGWVKGYLHHAFDYKHPLKSAAILTGSAIAAPAAMMAAPFAGAGYLGYKAVNRDLRTGPRRRLSALGRGANMAGKGILYPLHQMAMAAHFGLTNRVVNNKYTRGTAKAAAMGAAMAPGVIIGSPAIAASYGLRGMSKLGNWFSNRKNKPNTNEPNKENKIPENNQMQKSIDENKTDNRSPNESIKDKLMIKKSENLNKRNRGKKDNKEVKILDDIDKNVKYGDETIDEKLSRLKAKRHKKKNPFYDTDIDGHEVRKGGYKYWKLLHKLRHKKTHVDPITGKVVEDNEKHGLGSFSLLGGLGSLFGKFGDIGKYLGIGSLLLMAKKAIFGLGKLIFSKLYSVGKFAVTKSLGLAKSALQKSWGLLKTGGKFAAKKAGSAFNWIKSKLGYGDNTADAAGDATEDVAGDATADVATGGAVDVAADAGVDVAADAGIAGGLEATGAAADATGVGLPVGLAIGAVGLAIMFRKQIAQGAEYLWNKTKKIAPEIWKGIKTGTSDMTKALLNTLKFGGNFIANTFIKGPLKALADVFGKLLPSGVKKDLTDFSNNVEHDANNAWNDVTGFFGFNDKTKKKDKKIKSNTKPEPKENKSVKHKTVHAKVKDLPLGIKINNPGYIKNWPLVPNLPKKNDYVVFKNKQTGIIALIMKIRYYVNAGDNTLTKLIKALDLPIALNESSLAKISVLSDISIKEILKIDNAKQINGLVKSIIEVCNGKNYYDETLIRSLVNFEIKQPVANILNDKKLNIPSQMKTPPVVKKNITNGKVTKKKSPSSLLGMITSAFAGGALGILKDIGLIAGKAYKEGTQGLSTFGKSVYQGAIGLYNYGKAVITESIKKIKQTIKNISQKFGFPADYLTVIAAHESGLKNTARAPGSSAAGLYQYIDSTWRSGIQFANSRGANIPSNASPFDVKYSTIVAGMYYKHDVHTMSSVINPVHYVDIYMMHFLGHGGGREFMQVLQTKPNTPADQYASYAGQQASANPSLFYRDGHPLSVKELYTEIGNQLNARAKEFNINFNAFDSIDGSKGSSSLISKNKSKVNKIIKNSPAKTATKHLAATAPAVTGNKPINHKTVNHIVVNKNANESVVSHLHTVDQQIKEKRVAEPTKYHNDQKTQSIQDRSKELRDNNKKTVNHSVETNGHLKTIKDHSAKAEQILKEQLMIQKEQLYTLRAIHTHITNGKSKDKINTADAIMGNNQNVVEPQIPLRKGANGNNFKGLY